VGVLVVENNEAENLPRSVRPGPSGRNPRQLSKIAHDLKNCMSILLYWVEMLETDRGSSAPSEESLDDLKKLTHKMNCLIERLSSL
jgi:hypothetical protein